MSPAYGFDDDGEREHDSCDRCGRGSCPGSGSGGEDACNDHLRRKQRAAEAIERELVSVWRRAGAPRNAELGCSTVSHERLSFCSSCTRALRDGGPNGFALEVMGWRLLAMAQDADV